MLFSIILFSAISVLAIILAIVVLCNILGKEVNTEYKYNNYDRIYK